MMVTYLANNEAREINAQAGQQLIDAGICRAAAPKEPPKKPQPKPEKPTKVEPLTTDDVPMVPQKKGQ